VLPIPDSHALFRDGFSGRWFVIIAGPRYFLRDKDLRQRESFFFWLCPQDWTPLWPPAEKLTEEAIRQGVISK
jgi:hypothetical protein